MYGTWRAEGTAQRTAARLELAEYLAAQHRREELLSETLVLQSEAGNDPKVAARVPGFFMQAGSADRAVAAYSELVKSHPNDTEPLRGLADANSRQASSVVRRQLGCGSCGRDDATAATRLQFAASLEQIDPTPRRLRSAEKLRRSKALLEAVQLQLGRCGVRPVQTPKISGAHGAAAKNEDAESVISEAEKLWVSRPMGYATGADDPVILMQKVRSP